MSSQSLSSIYSKLMRAIAPKALLGSILVIIIAGFSIGVTVQSFQSRQIVTWRASLPNNIVSHLISSDSLPIKNTMRMALETGLFTGVRVNNQQGVEICNIGATEGPHETVAVLDEMGTSWGVIHLFVDRSAWVEPTIHVIGLISLSLLVLCSLILISVRHTMKNEFSNLDRAISAIEALADQILSDPVRNHETVKTTQSPKNPSSSEEMRLVTVIRRLAREIGELAIAIRLSEAEKAEVKFQARTDEAIARTTQMLAHDVRKPFSMLRIGLAMLGNAKDPENVKKVMSRVVPQIDSAMSGVDGMLADVMEIGSSSVKLIQEAVSPESIIESTLGDVVRIYPDAKISFSYDFEHTHLAYVHVQKISRVFSNIVDNAFQEMRYKGSMWFKTLESNGMIAFCIGNSGSVIPEENLSKLFDTFFTSGKKGGTGLGLAIAQKVVNAHGGKIWCESSKTPEHPEGKVEFLFTLPTANQLNATTASLPQHSSDIAKQLTLLTEKIQASISIDKGELSLEEDVLLAHSSIGRPLRVLIVDDEPIYRSALASHMMRTPELSKAFELTQADGSIVALQAITNHDYDFIITDVDMGKKSLNGFELVAELRRLGSKALICIHSNRIVAADNKFAIESGADSFIPKPIAHAQLLRLLLQAGAAVKTAITRINGIS